VLFDSDQIPGYDQLRGVFAAFPAPTAIQPNVAAIPTMPSNGTVRVSAMILAPM
jgi:hypothetical protein